MISALKDVFTWCRDNFLTINSDKTCYTLFSGGKKTIHDQLNNIKVGNSIIKRVKSATYLGVTLDENLSWSGHINKLCNSLTKIGNAFKVIKYRIPDKNKVQLYYAYVYSKIQYGIEVYGRCNMKTIKKVQTKQNRALKILYSKDHLTPTITIHKELVLLKVTEIHKVAILKFVFRQNKELTPSIFKDTFKTNLEVHTYNTRQKNNLHIIQPNNNFSKYTVRFQGPKPWNSIPTNIRSSKSIKSFARNVKQHFINSY